MNRHLSIALLVSLPFRFFGQYSPQFTQFWNTYTSVNPAAAGLYNRVNVSAAYISRPHAYSEQQLYAGASARISQIHGGLSLTYAGDSYHVHENTSSENGRIQSAMLGYAFHIRLKGDRALSAGISGGLTTYHFSSNDGVTTQDKDATAVGGAGLAYRGLKWRLGLSVTNLVLSNRSSEAASYRGWDAWLTAERDFSLGEKWLLTPRIQLGIYADVSVVTQYRKRLWFGLSSRLFSAGYLGGMIGCDFKEKFRIGYSYQHYLSTYYGKASDNHELILSFYLK